MSNDSAYTAQYSGYLIKKDSSKYDKNIEKIQQRLIELGYDIGACGVDGVVGTIIWGRLFV
ncbi:hypothetical protein SH2C18_04060 [Clostridium sediminicola]|uniref:peptidoglycan-binding domain-containing protein n=1 Tax=Clostridium sediminicola TaxID=3114879 RepID=UPI0031F215E9